MAMLEFADARRVEYEATERTEWRDTELSSIAHELAVELQMSVRSVQNRLHQAREVRGRAPAAWEAFLSGRIDGYRVRIISEALGTVHDPRSDGVIDDRVVGFATTHTATELRAWLRRLITRLEPELHEERSRDAVSDRRVHIDHRDDGVSELWALLPTAQAAAIDTLLGESLLGKESDDTRTSDQFMADELSRRLLAGADGEPAVKATIALDDPGHVVGRPVQRARHEHRRPVGPARVDGPRARDAGRHPLPPRRHRPRWPRPRRHQAREVRPGRLEVRP